jgi:SH3 domain-containing YSC84-like protein 1
MRIPAFCCAMLLAASSAFAALSSDQVKRLNESATILGEMRQAPDTGISEELWEKAECVIVIPSVKKGAFIVGGEYGSGVMSCRRKGSWTAPVFMQLAKGSWGLQIGAQEVDLVLLVMNKRGVDKLLGNKVSLGADASVAAGPVGRSAHAATDLQLTAEMLSYSRTHGVFAGIDLSGGVLRPDREGNERAYGSGMSARAVVEDRNPQALPEAKGFIASLTRSAHAAAN